MSGVSTQSMTIGAEPQPIASITTVDNMASHSKCIFSHSPGEQGKERRQRGQVVSSKQPTGQQSVARYGVARGVIGTRNRWVIGTVGKRSISAST